MRVLWRCQASNRGVKLTNGASRALTLAMSKEDQQCQICELQKVQRPTKLFEPSFALETHSYDDLYHIIQG
jgi:hypothetical protein